MPQTEQIVDIYSHLPSTAQQEAFDFMVFLQQRYGKTPDKAEAEVTANPTHSIRNNPAFGMWSDMEGDSREQLKQIRQTQWTRE